MYHPKFGELEVDTGTRCPEVDESVAVDLIGQYELYVGHQDIKSARIRCMRDRGTGELMEMVCKGDTHADAAFSVFVSRMIPEVSPEVCENCIASRQDGVWNRRTRRTCLRSQGIVVHAFCGGAKRAFEHAAHKWDFAHLSIDSAEDLLNDSTYRFLLQQARDGKIRGLVGGPPSRTFSAARLRGIWMIPRSFGL